MTKTKVFLVSSDDTATSAHLATALRERGIEVHAATTGVRALELVAKEQPELAIVAVDLPDMSGAELCELLASNPSTADVAIICTDSHGDVDRRVACLERGAVDVIDSTIAPSELVARVERQLAVARTRRALSKTEAEFSSVMESAVDAIVSADAAAQRTYAQRPYADAHHLKMLKESADQKLWPSRLWNLDDLDSPVRS